MTPSAEVALEFRDRVAVITLDRPGARNALGTRFAGQMHEALTAVEHQDEVGCVIVTGRGTVFSGGGDLHHVMSPHSQPIHSDYKLIRGFNTVVARLRALDLPVIAAVNGPAVGGGAALALACDFAIVAQNARYDFLFGRLGLTGGDMGCAYLLSRALGYQRAAHLLLTGGSLSAEQLVGSGLAAELVADDLDRRALQVAREVAAGSQWANHATKLALRRSQALDLDAVLEYEAFVQAALFGSADHKERLQRLLDRGPR